MVRPHRPPSARTAGVALFLLALLVPSACRAEVAEGALPTGPLPVLDGHFPGAVRWTGRGEAPQSLASPPRAILPGNSAVLETIAALVGPERIVALPKTALEYSALAADPGPWAGHPLFQEFAAEALLAHAPDLVVASPFQSAAAIERLQDAGVAVLELPTVTTWEGIQETTSLLARLLGEEERGAALVREMDARRAALTRVADAPRVLTYTNYGSGGTTAGAGTTWDLMLGLAGCRNAATEAGIRGHAPVDFEQLLSLDPDVFLVGITPEGQTSPSQEMLTGDESLAGLTAIREGRIVRLPAYLYSSSTHHLLDAAEELVELLGAHWPPE